MAAEWINRFPISRQPINRDRESRQPINRWPRAAKEADESFSTIPLAKYTAKYAAKESVMTVQAKDFYTLSQGIDDALSQYTSQGIDHTLSQLLVYGHVDKEPVALGMTRDLRRFEQTTRVRTREAMQVGS